MIDRDAYLVGLAAWVDSIYAAHRRGSLHASPSQADSQRFYVEDGDFLPEGSSSERKRFERQRRALARDGLVEIVGSPRCRGIKLTISGYFRARGLAGLPGFDVTLRVMRRLDALVQNSGKDIDELALAGLTGYDGADKWRARVDADEAALRSAVIFGWVDCAELDGSPDGGRCEWKLTEGGHDIIQRPLTFPKAKRDREAVAIYNENFATFPRAWTAKEKKAEADREWDSARRSAYYIVRDLEKRPTNSIWPPQNILDAAIAKERAAFSEGRTFWPGLENYTFTGTEAGEQRGTPPKQEPAAVAAQKTGIAGKGKP